MKKLLPLSFFICFAIILNAQQNFSITYNFNNNYTGQIVQGADALVVEDAVIGSENGKLSNIGFQTVEGQTVLGSTITNNNATNYRNTFLRLNIKPKAGYTFVVTNVIVNQNASLTGSSYLFRIGSTLNQTTPDNLDRGSSTDNVSFSNTLTNEAFAPSMHVAKGKDADFVTIWLSARGPNVATFNWNVNSIEIKGQYIATGTESSANVSVSSTIKQNLRFGIDAERLWFWQTGLANTLADLGAKELKSEFARVAINCAYEREQGVKNVSAYDNILNMMTALKQSNPNILFFASPRPLEEAYTDQEVIDLWGGNVPWAPVPSWIMTWNPNGTNIDGTTKWKIGTIHVDKLAQYYADYLNVMHANGFKIDFMDITNEKNEINATMCKYLFDNIPSLLAPGVYMPKLIAPSAWNYQQGVNYLNTFTPTQLPSFNIAACHNTEESGTPESFVTRALELGKEPWESELHGWIGIAAQDEILTSDYFFNHVKAGFVGLDTWLFYGPKSGKDHTMIWSNATSFERSSKYEIFKKVVNNANGGNYVETSQSAGVIGTSFIKDNTFMVWFLNDSYFDKPNSVINFGSWDVNGKTIEVTEYKSNIARAGSVTNTSTSSGTLTFDAKAASLYCFKVELTSLGVNDLAKNKISVFPNPASNILYLKGIVNATTNKYQIITLDGRLINSGIVKNNSINASNLAAGMYILNVKDDTSTYVTKFMVK